MRTALAVICLVPLAVAAWKFAPRTPAVRRDPEATPLPSGDTLCLGPRLATRPPDLLTPGGEREPICGFATARGMNYAWTRHAVFVRVADDWTLIARSREALSRVVALPSGALAVVDTSNALLSTSERDLVQIDGYLLPVTRDGLLRIELARRDARERGEPLPATPLSCLLRADEASLTITKRRTCMSPGDLSVRVAMTASGATVTDLDTGITRPINFGESLAEFAAADAALFADSGAALSSGVRLAWTCDGAPQGLNLGGRRAVNLHAIAQRWRTELIR